MMPLIATSVQIIPPIVRDCQRDINGQCNIQTFRQLSTIINTFLSHKHRNRSKLNQMMKKTMGSQSLNRQLYMTKIIVQLSSLNDTP